MFSYMLSVFATTLVTGFSTYLFYKIDGHNIIYHTVERKYRKWKRINKLVSSHHDSIIDIYSISFKMVLKAMKLALAQYLNDSVKKLDKNTYELQYIINGKLYKMIIIPKKGPSPIIQIRDDNDTDVTEEILPYYGPNYNWHSISIIPQLFKCKSLTFELADGDTKTFSELDYIEI